MSTTGTARPRVLVGFADALAAIETAWCLQDHGFEVVAFGRQGRPAPLARVPGVRVVPVHPPERDAKRTLAELAGVVAAVEPAVVLPLDDHAVWLADRLAADDVTIPVAGPTGPATELALDKRLQLTAAAHAGLLVPPTADGSAANAVPACGSHTAPPLGGPPWVVKSALAVVERDGHLCRPPGRTVATEAEAVEAAAALGGPALVQARINGVGEGVFGLATPRGVRAWSAHRRVRMMNPRGSGSSACRSIPVEAELRGAVERFVVATGWRGLFMIEVLRDEAGRPWLMELNGRPWGSMALARHRGLPYPAWAVRLALDPDFEPDVPDDPPHVMARHLGRELVHVGAVTRGRLRGEPGPSPWRTLREVARLRRADRWYNWRRGATRVVLADTAATVRAQLGGRRAHVRREGERP